jgi:hypothetical protein
MGVVQKEKQNTMLRFKEKSKNLGNIAVKSVNHFEVELFNDAPTTMEITDVKPGCGSCTVARVASAIIPAGGKTTLKATFTPESEGFNSKRITISYKVLETVSKTVFTFTAQVG